jgi:hypothetical protein
MGGVSKRLTGFSEVAWAEPPGEMSAHQWAVVGQKLGAISRACQWWIGDWLRFGNRKWGEKYVQAARHTGYDITSLRNMAWVASQFDLSLRRSDLTWSHHVLLAPFEQEQKRYWLAEAAARGLTVADLRIALRSVRSGNNGEASTRRELTNGRSSPTSVCPSCGQRLKATP